MKLLGDGMSIVTKVSFRESFKFPIYFVPDVFKILPNHMAKGLTKMRAKTYNCNCVIEIRDARVPISSFNPQFEHLFALRPRIVLINKIDLADKRTTSVLVNKFIKNDNTKVLYTNCHDITNKGIKNVMKEIRDMVCNDETMMKPQTEEGKEKAYKALVYGIPNVGKSTFINSTRQRYTSHTKSNSCW